MKKYLFFLSTIFYLSVSAQEYVDTKVLECVGVSTLIDNYIASNGYFLSGGLYNNDVTFNGQVYASVGGLSDGIFYRYDADGTEVDAFVFGGGGSQGVSAVCEDPNGNYIITGYFEGAGALSMDADPGPGEVLLGNTSALGSRDMFIVKLDSNGQFIWAKQVSNPSGAAAEDSYDIDTDSAGNVYVVGKFVYADFDPDPAVSNTILTSSNTFEGFLLKLNSNGEFEWVRQIANSQSRIRSIYIDDADNIIVGGEFTGTVEIDPNNSSTTLVSNGAEDGFIISYNSSGDINWSTSFGGPAADRVFSVVGTATGFVATGEYGDQAYLDPANTATTYPSNGDSDVFITQFDSSANPLHIYTFGGVGKDVGEYVTVSPSGNILATGVFNGLVDFNPSTPGTITATAVGTPESYTVLIDPTNQLVDHYIVSSVQKASSPKVNMAGSLIYQTGSFANVTQFDYFNQTAQILGGSISTGYLNLYRLETLGVEDVDLNANFSIYPNPTSDFIKIEGEEFSVYSIYSMEGRLLRKGNLNSNQIVDVQSLTKGNYLLQLENKINKSVKTFIKK